LAPEPFSDEFSVEYLTRILKNSKRNIKQFLLDQTKVCGVGNIYASEAMFIAGINPHKSGCQISRRNVAGLHSAIREVMNETLELGTIMRIDRENIAATFTGRT
jgi:formamidopyrimidine-DNA glycosylase